MDIPSTSGRDPDATLRVHSFRLPSASTAARSSASTAFSPTSSGPPSPRLLTAMAAPNVFADAATSAVTGSRFSTPNSSTRFLGTRRMTTSERFDLALQSLLVTLASPAVTRPLKCALAYLIASMVVFNSSISALFGTFDAKHLAATASVYFHASRSVGSMIEATIFAEIALTYSALLSFFSMLTSGFFYSIGYVSLGHFFVLLIFCGGGLGSIAFMKQRLNRAIFNTSCSLASVAFATILIREGSIQDGRVSFSKMIQVSIIVNCGILIATAVCFLVFPVTAIAELKASSNKLLHEYGQLIKIVTNCFVDSSALSLAGFDHHLDAAHSLHSALDTSLHEAMFEHHAFGTVNEFAIQTRFVRSVQEILRLIGGLRSSHIMKLRLMDIEPGYRKVSCAEVFDVFVHMLSPQLRNIAQNCQLAFDKLQFSAAEPGVRGARTATIAVSPDIRESLLRAREEFSRARDSTLRDIYAMDMFRTQVQSNNEQVGVYLEEIVSVCGQFTYGVLCLVEGILSMLAVIDDYNTYLQQSPPASYDWLTRSASTDGIDLHPYIAVIYGFGRFLPIMFKVSSSDNDLKNVSTNIQDPVRLRVWRALRVLRRTDVRYGIKVGMGAMLYTAPAYIAATRPWFMHYRAEWGLVTFVIVVNISIGGTLMTAFYRILGTCLGTTLAYLAWQIAPGNAVVLPLIGFCISCYCFHIILTGRPNSVFGRFILLTFNLTAFYSYSISRADFDEDDEDEGGNSPVVGEIAFHRLVSVTCGVIWGVFITLYVWPISARVDLKQKLGVLWVRMGLLWKFSSLGSLPSVSPTSPYHQHHSSTAMTISGVAHEEEVLAKSLLKMFPLLAQANREFRLKGPFPLAQYQSIMRITEEILDSFYMINAMLVRESQISDVEHQIIEYTEQERTELNDRIFLLFYLLSSSLRLGLPLPESLPNTERTRDRLIAKINQFRLRQIRLDTSSSLTASPAPSVQQSSASSPVISPSSSSTRVNVLGGDTAPLTSMSPATQGAPYPITREEDFVLMYSFILATLTINDGLRNIAAILHQIYGAVESEVLAVV
ncbi:Fusaric acid resistance protein-like-domain-containing protein [Limtongia smithiae]|uniref:Fusaric acid resistance protein-like-domain-containing protein n=1 Tax=Limtongia smithiae TaxID=1125753 RepID=UPI0034CD92F5